MNPQHRKSILTIALFAAALAFADWLRWHLGGRFGPEIARKKTLEYLTG